MDADYRAETDKRQDELDRRIARLRRAIVRQNIKHLWKPVALAFAAGAAAGYIYATTVASYPNPNACILDKVGDAPTVGAVTLIRRACYELYGG